MACGAVPGGIKVYFVLSCPNNPVCSLGGEVMACQSQESGGGNIVESGG